MVGCQESRVATRVGDTGGCYWTEQGLEFIWLVRVKRKNIGCSGIAYWDCDPIRDLEDATALGLLCLNHLVHLIKSGGRTPPESMAF